MKALYCAFGRHSRGLPTAIYSADCHSSSACNAMLHPSLIHSYTLTQKVFFILSNELQTVLEIIDSSFLVYATPTSITAFL